MDAPYAGAKPRLAQEVARTNRCRAVWSEKLGFITVIGADTDLDLVELLSTSLLLQANRRCSVRTARSPAPELTDRLFPTMTQRLLSVSNMAGWSGGRAAADLALFDVHATIAG
jgi:hypothetical protein